MRCRLCRKRADSDCVSRGPRRRTRGLNLVGRDSPQATISLLGSLCPRGSRRSSSSLRQRGRPRITLWVDPGGHPVGLPLSQTRYLGDSATSRSQVSVTHQH